MVLWSLNLFSPKIQKKKLIILCLNKIDWKKNYAALPKAASNIWKWCYGYSSTKQLVTQGVKMLFLSCSSNKIKRAMQRLDYSNYHSASLQPSTEINTWISLSVVRVESNPMNFNMVKFQDIIPSYKRCPAVIKISMQDCPHLLSILKRITNLFNLGELCKQVI